MMYPKQLIFVSFCLVASLFMHPLKAQTIQESDVGFIQHIRNSKSDTLYIINFWATWCKPCIEELPAFEKIDSLYKNQKVKVILFNLDTRKQVEGKLTTFLQNKNIHATVYTTDVVNFNKHIEDVSPNWSGALPATLVWGKTKQSRQFFEKTFTFAELQQLIEPLITHP